MTLRPLAEALAAELSGYEPTEDWCVLDNPEDWAHNIIHPDGRTLRLFADRNCRGKARISGMFPRGLRGSFGAPPTIGVSPERGAGEIVRDVRTRLMPEYVEALVKAREYVRAQEKQEASIGLASNLVQQALEALGHGVYRASRGPCDDATLYAKGHKWTVTGYQKVAVKLEITLSPAEALELMRACPKAFRPRFDE